MTVKLEILKEWTDDDQSEYDTAEFASFWNNLFAASGGADNLFGDDSKYEFNWKNVEQYILENYRGRVKFANHAHGDSLISHIEFDSEEDATAFLLRWA